MTCASCAASINRLLQRKGLKDVSANAATGEVHFKAEPTVSLPGVYDAIDGLGYHVVREGEDSLHSTHEGGGHGPSEDRFLPLCIFLTVPLLAHMFTAWAPLHNPWVQAALATPVFLMGTIAFGPSAFRSLRAGAPNMNVLIVLGATAAFGYSLLSLLPGTGAHRYLFFETAASIITLVMLGNRLEHRTVKRTTASIDALARLQPRRARLVMRDSIGRETVMDVDTAHLRTGDLVRVATGEAIPTDGVVVEGTAGVDEGMITGEGRPVLKTIGDAVVGGTVTADGGLLVETTAVGKASALARIIRLVQEAQGAKPPLQKLADKIAAVFVPAVLGISGLTLVINYFIINSSLPEAVSRAIAVLVISCPCAMGLATPAAVAVGLGRAARRGILIKGGDTLERMKGLRTVVFDKTGTLTTGALRIGAADVQGMEEEAFREVAAALETHSAHPIARSIVRQWGSGSSVALHGVVEHKGRGVEGTDAGGARWQIGSYRWLSPAGAPDDSYDLYLLQNGTYRGAIRLEDDLRPDAAETVRQLKRMGLRTVLLSGDKAEHCARIGAALGLDEVHAEATPESKDRILQTLTAAGPTAMVGDGINDAPALARATVGFSLSDATGIAVQSAQVILSSARLSSLPEAIRLGTYTEATIRSNLFWAFLYNVVAIPVAAAGLLHPTWGAGVMALSDVVLVLNSLRLGVRRLT